MEPKKYNQYSYESFFAENLSVLFNSESLPSPLNIAHTASQALGYEAHENVFKGVRMESQ